MFNERQIEDIVLGLADIIEECRWLRRENARLREVEREYREYATETLRRSQDTADALLMLGLVINDKEREGK